MSKINSKKWKLTKLGKVLSKSYKNGIYKSADYYGKGISILRINDFDNQGNLSSAQLQKVYLNENEIRNFKLNINDIVVNRVNSLTHIGKSILWNKNEITAVYESNMMRIGPDEKTIKPEFLIHILHHEPSRNFLRRVAKRAVAQSSINQQDVKALPLLLPPLSEQKAIADLLSTWDEAIEKTERLIQVKEKQLRQMSRWLLFGHKRLGYQKNDLADGHFFNYPSDWGLVQIGKVAKEVSSRNGESEETVLSCSKYDGFVNSLDYFGKQVFSSDTSNYKVVKKGQFGYPSNHVEEGSIGLLQHCEKGIVSPIYVVFEASKEKVHSPYLYKLFKTDIYRHIFQVSTSSSVDRRGSLRWGDFSKIKVLVPSLEEQQQISETLSSAQQEIDMLNQLVAKYKTQKRGLMQKMLTGEWRVKPEIVNRYMEA